MHSEHCKKIIGNYSYYAIDKIGEGYSSEVFKGKNDLIDSTVAIKVMSRVLMHQNKNEQQIQKEIETLEKLRNCPNILQIEAVVRTKSNIYLVSEFCEGGTIAALIYNNGKIAEEKACDFIEQIIVGYRQISRENIIHRDLKPANIMLSKNLIKIADFGFSTEVKQYCQSLDQKVGSSFYMAPQTLKQNKYSFKSDIWSIGIIFLQMIMGKLPWKSKTLSTLINEIQKTSIEQFIPQNINRMSHLFLIRALQVKMEDRMGLNQFLQFSFSSKPYMIIKGNNKNQKEQQDIVPQIKQKIEINHNEGISQTKCARVLLKKNTIDSKETNQSEKQINQKIQEINFNKKRRALKSKQSNIDFRENDNNFKQDEGYKSTKVIVHYEQVQNEEQLMEKQSWRYKNDGVKMTNDGIKAMNEKLILKQVQSQINYFRYLFKFVKKYQSTILLKSTFFNNFKQNIYHLVFQKIKQISQLSPYLKLFSYHQINNFKQTIYYTNIVDVVNQYKFRYQNQEKIIVTPFWSDYDKFKINISLLLSQIYNNLNNNIKEEPFGQKQNLIILFDQIMKIKRLHEINKITAWQKFQQASYITRLVDDKQKMKIDINFWKNAKLQYFTMAK